MSRLNMSRFNRSRFKSLLVYAGLLGSLLRRHWRRFR
jgi:hypothetical protein